MREDCTDYNDWVFAHVDNRAIQEILQAIADAGAQLTALMQEKDDLTGTLCMLEYPALTL
jgi:hypothetical protein